MLDCSGPAGDNLRSRTSCASSHTKRLLTTTNAVTGTSPEHSPASVHGDSIPPVSSESPVSDAFLALASHIVKSGDQKIRKRWGGKTNFSKVVGGQEEQSSRRMQD